MPPEKYDLLRGKIRHQQFYQSPKGFGSQELSIPVRNPRQHKQLLEGQLVQLLQKVSSRAKDERVLDAQREIVAVKPEKGSVLPPKSLADKREDVRLISQDPNTGTVLIDAPSAELKFLKSKLNGYIDDSKISEKSGLRSHEKLLSPIAEIQLATVKDLADIDMLKKKLNKAERYWFELGCRGGLRMPAEEAENSRNQIREALKRLKHDGNLEEFQAVERTWFFLKLTPPELVLLTKYVDCLYELSLAPTVIRDFFVWKEFDKPETIQQLQKFKAERPPANAPAVVLLDTGIATRHPMLAEAILSANSAVPENSSPEDTFGHGTEMSGLALYDDIGLSISRNSHKMTHWLQSCKLLTEPGLGIANEANRHFWPRITENAVNLAESADDTNRQRIFTMAVTASVSDPGDTLWSGAIDQLCYNNGKGRLFLVSLGNTDSTDVNIVRAYPNANLLHKIEDPAHAVNALTIGAYSAKNSLPPDETYANYTVIGQNNSLSPHSRSGYMKEPIKPDVVFEGGNVGFDGHVPDSTVPTLTQLTTGHRGHSHPIVLMWGTSAATANGARFQAELWKDLPNLRCESIRALTVHSASWTAEMLTQFPKLDERLALCGYGVPNLNFAKSCRKDRATVIVEDRMPNRTQDSEGKNKRVVKLFEMPVPRKQLLNAGNNSAKLRVTLSYFAEPNTVRRTMHRGMDLQWDMQGPDESKEEFLKRINKTLRTEGEDSPDTSSFPWKIGKQRRSRGTVQSDRWDGIAADLAGAKWIAVYPVSGWWDDRKALQLESTRFSLIVTVEVAGLEIYNLIKTSLEISLSV